jgi:MFS family permease
VQVSSGTAFAREVEGNVVATLPVGVLVCMATVSMLVCPQVIKIVSRRALFITSSVFGILGAGLMSYAVHEANFILFTIAAAPQGIAYGVSNLYRFYATDTALPQYRGKVLAAVVGGAVLSAFIGPEASRCATDVTPNDVFSSAYTPSLA